jgi:hypothetical protein
MQHRPAARASVRDATVRPTVGGLDYSGPGRSAR